MFMCNGHPLMAEAYLRDLTPGGTTTSNTLLQRPDDPNILWGAWEVVLGLEKLHVASLRDQKASEDLLEAFGRHVPFVRKLEVPVQGS